MKRIKNFPKIDLVILVGGKGSRIKNKLKNFPKPMIKISNKSFLDYILNIYCSYPFNKIYLMCGFRASKIIKKYHNTTKNFVKIECVKESKPLGTGGCLKLISKKVSKNFLLVNGDTYLDSNYTFCFNKKNFNKNIILLTKNQNYKSNTKLINLDINKNKKIYFKKNSNFINGGVYFFNHKMLKKLACLKKTNISLEDDLLNDEINNKKIYGIKCNDFFLDIGTKKNLSYAEKKLKKISTKPAAFFDRDGVINIDFNYVHKISNFKFQRGIIKFLQKISQKYFIFILTNQAGIAHGLFKIENFLKLQINLKKYLFMKKILINDVQYCPFHPEAKIIKYRKSSNYRKPGNLMIKALEKKWNILKYKSFMVGDKKTDEICANKSNLRFFYYKKIINI